MHKLLWNLIVKIFAFVMAGAILGVYFEDKREKMLRLFVFIGGYILVPVYVFLSLWSSPVGFFSANQVLYVALAVMGGSFLLSIAFSYLSHSPVRDVSLPIVFMNSAYLGIPVSSVLWGEKGIIYAIIYSAAVTIVQFTLGVFMVCGRRSLLEAFRLPFIYAAVAGALFNIYTVPINAHIMNLVKPVENITLPLMLIFTGLRMGKPDLNSATKALVSVVFRIVGGFAISLLAITYLKITDPILIGTLVMLSSMPAAVNSFILAERFKADPEYTSTAILLGTLATFFSIPLINEFLFSYLYCK